MQNLSRKITRMVMVLAIFGALYIGFQAFRNCIFPRYFVRVTCTESLIHFLKDYGIYLNEKEKTIDLLIEEGYSCACIARSSYPGIDFKKSGYYVYNGKDDRMCQALYGPDARGIKNGDIVPPISDGSQPYQCNPYDITLDDHSTLDVGKPVIYLYPKKQSEITVSIDFDGKYVATYPDFLPGTSTWHVRAESDGTITNIADNKEYSYLFWEGQSYNLKPDLTTGFVVKGSDTALFLQQKLAAIGLIPKEYNEFIVYWMPRMKENPYNLIHFVGSEYTEAAKLTIEPKPDSVLRVFMVYKPLTESIDLEPQLIRKFERKGFVVVEWGGSQVD